MSFEFHTFLKQVALKHAWAHYVGISFLHIYVFVNTYIFAMPLFYKWWGLV
jgi:hypothetical protein